MEFLDQFEQVNSKLEIKDPRGRPAGITIELRPMDSDEVRRVSREIQNENMKRTKDEFTVELQEANNLRTYAAAIVGWTFADGVTLGGKVNPEPTMKNKILLLKTHKVFRQIDTHLANDENFLPPLADPSPT